MFSTTSEITAFFIPRAVWVIVGGGGVVVTLLLLWWWARVKRRSR